jgi:glycosyltransferase involved in cell wall biosynthesis
MGKIKLLHIQLLPILSGVQKMMLLLLNALDKDRYEIYVICKPDGPLVNRLKEEGYNYLPVKSLRRNLSLWDPVALIHIFLLCREYRFDIVHTHSSKTGFLGRIAARIAGVKRIIHTVHGFPFHSHQFIVARYLYLSLEILASFFCDYLVVVNHYERNWILRKKLVNPRKILTVYNGIEPKLSISPRKYSSKGMVSPVKSNPDLAGFFVFGTVARFTRAKNIVNLTKVAISVCRENPQIKFVFIGDGELWDRCYDLVTSAGMNRQILMPGWQNNIEYWLMNIDVFVLYSHWEGLSISILEAMSLGLPVIASDIKGNNELVDNQNGILVSVDDHIRFRRILSELPHRKGELENWSQNSLTKSRTIFDLTGFARRYEEIYNK